MSDLRPHLTTTQLAQRWGVSASTLNNLRCAGLGIRYLKLGGAIRYRLADIEEYEEGRRVEPVAQYMEGG